MSELIILGIFALILAWVSFVFLTKRGRGVMFGGTIIKTWDGVSGSRKIFSNRVKVHAVDMTPTVRMVGLEISIASFASYQMIPITLPASEALALARLLEEAAKYRE